MFLGQNSDLSSRQNRLPRFFFIRHLSASALLTLGWYLLLSWYSNQLLSTLMLSLNCLILAGLLAAGPTILRIREMPRRKIFSLLCFSLLLLPWAEWLNITHVALRDTWTKQLFLQAVFIYLVILFLQLFPMIRAVLFKGTMRFLTFLSDRRWFWLPPLVFFLVSGSISIWVLDKTPLLQDSSAHLFQAKIFRELRLVAPEPILPEFFSSPGDMLVMKDGRWFSMYQPGFGLLLAGAMLLSAEWLLSPFLGALTVLTWMIYIRRWYDNRTAALFACLALTSPFLLMMSSTLMVYTPELFFVSLTILLCRFESEKQSYWTIFMLFLVLICVMLVRSFSSLIFLAPVLVFTGWKKLHKRSYLLPLTIAAGIIIGGTLLLYYQARTTGNPLTPGYSLEYPELNFGFGGTTYNHTPARGVANVSNNLLGLNSWLTGWYSGSLVFVFLFLIFQVRMEAWDLLLMAGSLAIIGFYFFHFFQDLIIGPRYYFVFAPFLLMLIARSAFVESPNRGSAFVLPLIAIFFISSLFLRLPEVVNQYHIESTFPGNMRQELDRVGSDKVLVFLDITVRPYFVNLNDPFLRGSAIICQNLGKRNAEIMKVFPSHRPVYFRTQNTMTNNAGYSMNCRFFDTPNPFRSDYVSMFQLTLAIQTASSYLDRDLFDITYSNLFNTQNSEGQLEYVRKGLAASGKTKNYAEHFRLGLLHTAQFLLLPKTAYDRDQARWSDSVPWDVFRREFQAAERSCILAGEVGKMIAQELRKARNRIDRNGDGSFSDEELIRFLKVRFEVMK